MNVTIKKKGEQMNRFTRFQLKLAFSAVIIASIMFGIMFSVVSYKHGYSQAKMECVK